MTDADRLPAASSPPPSTVLLARHGETDWNRADRRQGWAPVPLNDRGRRQARDLGRRIATDYTVDEVRVSDLPRATETAALIVEATGLERERVTDRRWRERHKGVLQGLGPGVHETHPEFFVSERGASAIDARPESGESYADLRDRVLDGWRALLAETDCETVLVVTHKGPLRVLLGRVRGLDLVDAFERVDPGNASLVELSLGDGQWRIADERQG